MRRLALTTLTLAIATAGLTGCGDDAAKQLAVDVVTAFDDASPRYCDLDQSKTDRADCESDLKGKIERHATHLRTGDMKPVRTIAWKNGDGSPAGTAVVVEMPQSPSAPSLFVVHVDKVDGKLVCRAMHPMSGHDPNDDADVRKAMS